MLNLGGPGRVGEAPGTGLRNRKKGVRLTETKNISKSLARLRNVIKSIDKGDFHLPYCNSELRSGARTLDQDSLT